MTWIRQRFEKATRGAPVYPLLALFLIFFVDEFDTAAFNTLAPDIKRAFHLTDARFGFIVILNLTIVLLVAVPVGYYGDRLPRRRLVLAGATAAGVFSFATGLAPAIGFLIAIRIGNGFGRLMNDSIHNSLLADYYPPESRAEVFGIHRNAVYLGSITGAALTGLLGTLFGWRVTFAALLVPLLAVVLYARRLEDPLRGGTDDQAAAEAAEHEEPVPIAEARRILN
jgi:MFS family permease